MWWLIALMSLVALVFVSCKASGGSETPVSKAQGSIPPGSAGVWADVSARGKAVSACFGEGHPGTRACVRQEMQTLGAPREARDFYDTTGEWLLSVINGPGKLRAGLVLDPLAKSPILQIWFVSGAPKVQEALSLLEDAFPTKEGESFSPFQADPISSALLAAAKKKFATADDPVDLRHFDIGELESSTTIQSGGQSFIVEVGIHNYCPDCGVGVAARYSFDFDANGKSTSVQLLGLCEGRQTTQDIQGFGKATFHEFSSVAAGKAGVSEEDPVIVPGLAICPEHISF